MQDGFLQSAPTLPAAEDFQPFLQWRSNFSSETVYKACYLCSVKFPGLHQLTKHLRLHIGSFECMECSKKLPTGKSCSSYMRI